MRRILSLLQSIQNKSICTFKIPPHHTQLQAHTYALWVVCAIFKLRLIKDEVHALYIALLSLFFCLCLHWKLHQAQFEVLCWIHQHKHHEPASKRGVVASGSNASRCVPQIRIRQLLSRLRWDTAAPLTAGHVCASCFDFSRVSRTIQSRSSTRTFCLNNKDFGRWVMGVHSVVPIWNFCSMCISAVVRR